VFEAALNYSLMKESWAIDEKVMARHGLYYALFFGEDRGDGLSLKEVEIVEQEGKLIQRDAQTTDKYLGDFFEENQGYLLELAQGMARNTNL
jgi:hypothetical protein